MEKIKIIINTFDDFLPVPHCIPGAAFITLPTFLCGLNYTIPIGTIGQSKSTEKYQVVSRVTGVKQATYLEGDL